MEANAKDDRLARGLEWTLIAIALAGTACVSVLHLVYLGHVFWLVSNVGLTVLNAGLRRWPYVLLFGVYLVFTLYGLFTWK